MAHVVKMKAGLVMISAAWCLAACGGAGGAGDDEERVVGPAVDASMYAEILRYCQSTAPTGAAAASNGWDLDYSSGAERDSVSVASPAGSNVAWDNPIDMAVNVRDFRGVTGKFVPTGFGKPEWKMGVRIPTVMRPTSAACVAQVAQTIYPVDPGLNLTGLVTPPLPEVDLRPDLIWRSYWNRDVPVSQAGGKAVDAFEYVGNFTPDDGQVYFVLDKSRFSAPQALSICHLPAGGGTWDCATATVGDAGENWRVIRRGVKQGVYLLTSPS